MKNGFLGLLIAVFVVVLNGQAKKPDFSGLWVMVSPEAGNQLLFKQDAATLTTGPANGQQGPTAVYKLDGAESRNVVKTEEGEMVTVSTASWNGRQLAIGSTITWPKGQTIEQLLFWSMNDQGQLVLEVQNR